MTHGELWEAVGTRERELLAANLRCGDRLALLRETSLEYVIDVLASFRLGIVLVPLNTALRGSSLEAVLNDISPSLLIVDSDFRDIALAAAAEVEGTAVHVAGSPMPRVCRPREPSAPQNMHESDAAAILLTSGTTGLPKGVVWPHAMVLAFAEHTTWVMGYRSDDVIYTCLPLFHINGLFCAVYAGLLTGAEVVISPRFSAASYWEDVVDCGATVTNMMGSIPAILWRQSPSPTERDHALRLAMVLPLPTDREGFERRFGFPTTEVYGSTDAGMPLGVPFGTSRSGSCGRPTPGWECRVVDNDENSVEDGVTGELLVRPVRPHIGFAGYWRHPDVTASSTRGGWLHTGDLVRRDAEGWYTYLGRAKEMIRVSGENVAPLQVESAVLQHPAVAEAAAYAIPSDLGEEAVAVAVVLHTGTSAKHVEIRSVAEQDLPYFAVPRYILITDKLPKTATSKVIKVELERRGVTTDHWDGGRPRRSR